MPVPILQKPLLLVFQVCSRSGAGVFTKLGDAASPGRTGVELAYIGV